MRMLAIDFGHRRMGLALSDAGGKLATPYEVLEISKPVMAEVLRESPEYLSALSELLAQRKLEGEGIVKGAAAAPEQKQKESEYRSSFLRSLRAVFEL